MRSLRPLLLLCLLGGSLAGCRPSAEALADLTPLDSLTSTAESHRFDLEFWTREAHAKSPLWVRAEAYCAPPRAERAAYPNCRFIRMASYLDRPPVLPPPPAFPPLGPHRGRP